MKRRFLVLVVALALASTGFGMDAAIGRQSELQGYWNLVSLEINGQALDVDKLEDATLFVRGERYSFALEDATLELIHKVDSTKSPKTLDMTIVEGEMKGKTYHAIYELENDILKICRNIDPDMARPTSFGSSPNSGLMVIVWKRTSCPIILD